jgi:hypothetical protein
MQLVMGRLPGGEKAVPLDIEVLQSERLAKINRKKIIYTASKDDRVPACLLIPHNLQGWVPAVLCLHGTSGPRGRTAGRGPEYARHTLELAQCGYVTIAPDYPLLGENRPRRTWLHERDDERDLESPAGRGSAPVAAGGRRRTDRLLRALAGRASRLVAKMPIVSSTRRWE